MINILMPVAGLAKRFIDHGYELPKPLISVAGVPMIKLAMQSLISDNTNSYRLIFVVREDHILNHDIGQALKNLFSDWDVHIIPVDHITQGTLCSCLIARDIIQLNEPLIIYTPDVCYESNFTPEDFVNSGLDGSLLTFKANSPDHSYVTIDENGLATKTAEKVVISGDALVGVYCFKTGEMFLKYADETINSGIKINNEFYISPMYNLLIRDKLKIGINRVEKMHVLGTPDDLQFYEQHVSKYNKIVKLAICSDHSGFALKESLRDILKINNIDFVDFGTHSTKDSDHYDSLKPCIEYLLTSSQTIGIGICSTGQGFNIAANKVKGIRAALVENKQKAALARKHNAANFFSLPSMNISKDDLLQIVMEIINNTFDGGRHSTRIRKINNDPLFKT